MARLMRAALKTRYRVPRLDNVCRVVAIVNPVTDRIAGLITLPNVMNQTLQLPSESAVESDVDSGVHTG